MLDRNHNLNGNHGDDLISYMYGELDRHARSAFESHLEHCDECAVELGAISDARLGVVEWRRNDFDHLATPEILVSQAENVRTIVAAREKIGFFAGLAELIRSASVFAKAGVGLAAAALLVGVVYFAISLSSKSDNIAVKNVNSSPASVVNDKNEGSKEERAAAVDKTPERPVTPIPVSEHSPSSVRPRSINAGQLADNRSKIRNNVNKIGRETAIKKAPRLNSFDDDEDRTLRLSDLFSQVGPTKR
jgi:hypothetical protein